MTVAAHTAVPAGPGDRLAAWLARGGARAGALAVGATSAGRGVTAARAIAVGETVLEVPAQLIITRELASASALGRRVEEVQGARGSHAVLAAFLLAERRAARSRFASYLAALPTTFPELPLCYPKSALGWLAGSHALERLAAQRDALVRDYAELCALVSEYARFSFAEHVWARLVVQTRVFTITVRGLDTDALVPMADMLNHHPAGETSWQFDDERSAFTMTAQRDFAPGAALHDSYGKKCNSRFLVNYGFCLDDNPDNEVVVAAAGQRFLVAARADHPGTRALLSHLRTSLAGPEQQGARASAPISTHHEQRVLRALAAAAGAALASCPPLPDDPPPGPASACALLRRGEQRILHHLVATAQHALPLLALDREHFIRAAHASAATASPLTGGYLAALAAAA